MVDAGTISLVVGRSLQQADPRPWQLGRGWRTNWESRLHGSFEEAFPVESGAATLFRPRGADGELTSTSGDRLHLEADGRAVHRGRDGVVTEFALHQGVGRPIRYTLPNGDHVTPTCSQDGPQVSGPDESRAVFQYDAGGNPFTEKVGDVLVQRCTYDSRLTRWQGIGSSRVRFSFYPNGLLHTLTDELDHTTTYEYNEYAADGRVRVIVESGGRTRRFQRDLVGRLVREIDFSRARCATATMPGTVSSRPPIRAAAAGATAIRRTGCRSRRPIPWAGSPAPEQMKNGYRRFAPTACTISGITVRDPGSGVHDQRPWKLITQYSGTDILGITV